RLSVARELRTDALVALGPVADEHGDVRVGEGALDPLALDDEPLAHLAGDAPRGGEVHEDRAPLGEVCLHGALGPRARLRCTTRRTLGRFADHPRAAEH